jgi:hypothetical protein
LGTDFLRFLFLAPVLVGACQMGGVDAATQAAACGMFVLGGSVRVIARHEFLYQKEKSSMYGGFTF